MDELICKDCGTKYSDLGLDMVLPDQQWRVINPNDDLLCANCICKRAKVHGGTVVLAWIDQLVKQ